MFLKSVDTDTNKLCRLCLYQGLKEDFVSINKNNDLIKKIEECISLKITIKNNFPSVICLACLGHLNQWSTFREVCHQSYNILLENYDSENCIEGSVQHKIDDLQPTETICNDYVQANKNESIDLGSEKKIEIKDQKIKDNLCSSIICHPNNSERSSKTLFKKTRRKIIKRRTKIKRRPKRREQPKTKRVQSDDSNAESTIEELEKYLLQLYQEEAEKEEYIYECDMCNESFSAIFDYLDHQETHNGQPVFRCQKCEQVFRSRQELVEHDSRHQVPCSKCGKLVLPSSLKSHMVLHTDKYKCTQCNWRFCNSTMLKQHVESVHIRLKTQVCETCGKSFTSTTSLQTHIKIHSDVRPYMCKICAYSGRTASALYTHMARHENGLHVCDACAKSFKSFRSLRDHTRRVHSQKKNHECGFCHKKFVDKYMLTVHIRTHTGARPYECNQCDRAFVRSDGLRDHLATHTQRAIYNCQQCGKKFIYRRSLGRHVCNAVANKL